MNGAIFPLSLGGLFIVVGLRTIIEIIFWTSAKKRNTTIEEIQNLFENRFLKKIDKFLSILQVAAIVTILVNIYMFLMSL